MAEPSEVTASKGGDAFTENKLLWIEQVAGDVKLPASAYRVAVRLATKYISREQGYAWPSVPTLARDLDISENAARTGLHKLQAGGHLTIEGKGGRNVSNRYRWLLKPITKLEGNEDKPPRDMEGIRPNSPTEQEGLEAETLQFRCENPPVSIAKPSTKLDPTPFEEPNEEPNEGKTLHLPLGPVVVKAKTAPSKPTRKPKAPDPRQAELKTEFELLGAQYPFTFHTNLDWAFRLFRIARHKTSFDEILQGAIRYAAHVDHDDQQMICGLQRWISETRWKCTYPERRIGKPFQGRPDGKDQTRECLAILARDANETQPEDIKLITGSAR